MTACGPNQFLCEDQLKCIDISQKCDLSIECFDGSDEDNCRMKFTTISHVFHICLKSAGFQRFCMYLQLKFHAKTERFSVTFQNVAYRQVRKFRLSKIYACFIKLLLPVLMTIHQLLQVGCVMVPGKVEIFNKLFVWLTRGGTIVSYSYTTFVVCLMKRITKKIHKRQFFHWANE